MISIAIVIFSLLMMVVKTDTCCYKNENLTIFYHFATLKLFCLSGWTLRLFVLCIFWIVFQKIISPKLKQLFFKYSDEGHWFRFNMWLIIAGAWSKLWMVCESHFWKFRKNVSKQTVEIKENMPPHTNFNHIMIISYGTGEKAIQPEEGLIIIQRMEWGLFSMLFAYHLRLMKKKKFWRIRNNEDKARFSQYLDYLLFKKNNLSNSINLCMVV